MRRQDVRKIVKLKRLYIKEKAKHPALEKPKLNSYVCESCGEHTISTESVEGTTPMLIPCGHCLAATAHSQWYKNVPEGEPMVEWYFPELVEVRGFSKDQMDHFRKGGLFLRWLK